ncbi:probable flavin-containing monooxygenase 1 [Benincasa hispida]|uniref:probable flavin-containing monooxygenase 1 n=1 Tax=Benincasa hispida TaxID=102211 RepID=UPI0018FF5A9F|nr:probable flavin-containing monooxygenase 1 [Benincasa hispida]
MAAASATTAEQSHRRRSVSKVAIIGAGISGITAAKHLSGHHPVVFEATDSIGGVWKHCAYRTTRLQTPRQDFEFSDYPWPPPATGNDDFPTYLEVLDYLHGYATHFNVLRFVKFNCKVVQLRYIGGPEAEDSTAAGVYGNLLNGRSVWEVAVEDTQLNTIQWYEFELVIICVGRYGDIPNIPKFPQNKGQEVFKGKVLHSMDYAKLDHDAARALLQHKRVVVVGYRKSAIDLAVECAQANQGPEGQPCTMVIRSLHWTVPSYRIWGLPFFLFYSTRFSQFLQESPNQGLFKALFCSLFSPMRKAISKFIESYLTWKLPLEKYGLKPEHPFEEDYASCQMAIMPNNFFEEAKKGKILFKKTSKWWFWSDGVQFEDNTKLEADVVILNTGFQGKQKLQSLLPHPFNTLLVDSSGIIPLYRGVIHPLIPNMGFVGYLESVSNLRTGELRCKWLARLAEDGFKLPTIHKMLQQTANEIQVMKNTTRFYKRQCVSTFSISYTDEIYQEMANTSN